MLTMDWKRIFAMLAILSGAAGLATSRAEGGVFEVSLGFSFNMTTFDSTSFTWTRRYGASAAYHFWQGSGVEVSFNVSTTRSVSGVQDAMYYDRVLAMNWVQTFLGQQSIFQPYVKLGLGQLVRDYDATYSNIGTVHGIDDMITVVMAAGFKLFFAKSFALRAEGVSYAPRGNFANWLQNASVNLGLSYYF